MLNIQGVLFHAKAHLSNAGQISILRQRGILFYPLALAAYPVFFWYGENAQEAFLYEVLVTLGVVVTATVLITLLLRLFMKDNGKVAAVVSICLVLFFIYGRARRLLLIKNQVAIGGILIGEEPYLSGIILALAVSGVTAVIMFRGKLATLVQLVALMALVLNGFNVGRVVSAKSGTAEAVLVDGQAVNLASFALPNVDQFPDIYYIILDAYGRDDVLLENFNFDNSVFTEFLKNRGFYIASESLSNYPANTELSIASSLSMRYLTKNEHPIPLLKDNEISSLLKSVGYQYVLVGSGWYTTTTNRHADVVYFDKGPLDPLVNDFSMAFFNDSLVLPLANTLGVNLAVRQFSQDRARHFIGSMRWLREIPEIEGPTFTFSHNSPPHPPYIFDRSGNVFTKNRIYNDHEEENQAYIDQLFYVNRSIESVVDEILKRSAPEEPIIIIQGDHGPQSSEPDTPIFPGNDHFKLERAPILNAYYLPEYCKSGLYPAISPVNSFRVVLNSCLGANFEILEDLSYWYSGLPACCGPPIDFSKLKK